VAGEGWQENLFQRGGGGGDSRRKGGCRQQQDCQNTTHFFPKKAVFPQWLQRIHPPQRIFKNFWSKKEKGCPRLRSIQIRIVSNPPPISSFLIWAHLHGLHHSLLDEAPPHFVTLFVASDLPCCSILASCRPRPAEPPHSEHQPKPPITSAALPPPSFPLFYLAPFCPRVLLLNSPPPPPPPFPPLPAPFQHVFRLDHKLIVKYPSSCTQLVPATTRSA
jgi:hypothetical protein